MGKFNASRMLAFAKFLRISGALYKYIRFCRCYFDALTNPYLHLLLKIILLTIAHLARRIALQNFSSNTRQLRHSQTGATVWNHLMNRRYIQWLPMLRHACANSLKAIFIAPVDVAKFGFDYQRWVILRKRNFSDLTLPDEKPAICKSNVPIRTAFQIIIAIWIFPRNTVFFIFHAHPFPFYRIREDQ